MMRRGLGVVLGLVLMSGTVAAQGLPPDLQLTPVISSGLTQPVAVRNASDGSGRLFLVERAGTIRIWNGTQLLVTPFLDINGIVDSESFSERGLLGLAFHPSYETNGFFYVYYTAVSPSGMLKIVRYSVSGGDANVADPNSALDIFDVDHPNLNHNGGDIHFGPDGYLFFATGDGGGGDDPDNNALDPFSRLGKMIRIDINNPSGGQNYGIPPGNPFDGSNGLREIWAYGLRNPWRFSFDRHSGDIFIGDVGQTAREEIDFQPAGAGGRNYGWDCWEGTRDNTASAQNPLCPTSPPPTAGMTFPILEYDHALGIAVTGGFRYRGPIGRLRGKYVYADYGSGRVWIATRAANGSWSAGAEWQDLPYNVSSFGEDEQGRLYLARFGSPGTIYRLDSPDSIFGDGFDLN